jgi:N4-gp56 family major capsid protein
MPNDVSTGAFYSANIPSWQRTYYEALLLETLRTKSIMVPFCTIKEDFRARDTGIINYTEVFDTDPDFNPLSEQTLWMRGAHLDSRSVQISLEIHGDTLKFSDYSEIVSYINAGNFKGLVQDKIGQNEKDMLDIMARNAFASHPNKSFAAGLRASRLLLQSGDVFDPDWAELARTHLEEAEVPGAVNTLDGPGQTIVCVTTPRVVHDIRNSADSDWLEVQEYNGAISKLTNEAGTWNSVRFIRTNRNVLRNAGAIEHQTTLDGATVVGQGAAATVDTVYSVGQSASHKHIHLASASGFEVGQYITISDVTLNGGSGNPPLETDGTIETRRIVALAGIEASLDRPLMKPHNTGDLVTHGVDIHLSFFMGGPAVVYGIGERPTPIFPPKIDDLQMINRYGWRGFIKFQMFRPEFIEVIESAGTPD